MSDAPGTVSVLVLSQHEVVRRQLVAHLSRSTALAVAGEPFSVQAILDGQPAVVILDLSRLGSADLDSAIEALGLVGGRLIALASIGSPDDEARVLDAGGVYRLKSGGADGLTDLVLDVAGPSASSG